MFLQDEEGAEIQQGKTKMVCITKELSDIITSHDYVLAANGKAIESSELKKKGLILKALSYYDNSLNAAPHGSVIYFEDTEGNLYTTTYNPDNGAFLQYTKVSTGEALVFNYKEDILPCEINPYQEVSQKPFCLPQISINRANCTIHINNKGYSISEEDCNCTTPISEKDILGNSDSDFQEWFKAIDGVDAIPRFEDFLYYNALSKYEDGIGRALYGLDRYGFVAVPQSIKDELRKNAERAAFPTIKSLYALDRSGVDPSGINFKINPIAQAGYYYFRALAVTSTDEGYEMVTDVGIQVGIMWLTEIVPTIIKNYKWKGFAGSGEAIKKAIQKRAAEIDNFMKTPEFKSIMDNAWSRYKGKLSRADWDIKYKTLYKNKEIGKITENEFNKLFGSDALQLEIQTGNGKRYIDNVKGGTAREVKSGNVTWSAYKDQVLKDIEIVSQKLGGIDRIEWHCFDDVDNLFINNVNTELQKAGLTTSDFIIITY